MLWIGIGIWSPHHAFSTTIVCQIWKDKIIHGSLLGDKCDHHAVVEALNPNNGMIPNGSHIHSKQTKGYWQPSYAEHGDKDPQSCCYHLTCGTGLEKTWSIMDHCWVTTTIMIPSTSGWNSKPTWTMVSTPHISKVIHNLLIHMLWMGIWSPHHAVTTTLVGPGLESQLKSLITTRCKMIPSCSGWGSHPTWNGSHFHFKHIKSYWHLHICCGWGYGAPIMLLPPHLWDPIWKVLPGDKWNHHAVVEALIPPWNGSHIHSKHTQGGWHTSYAVDGGL